MYQYLIFSYIFVSSLNSTLVLIHCFCVRNACLYIYFILSSLIGSGSPNNSDDDQKMNNFIEKGTVFFSSIVFLFFLQFIL